MEENDHESQEILLTLDEKSDEDLRGILDDLYAEEARMSYRRRILHARIDIVREELVKRMKDSNDRGQELFGKEDIERLSEILAKEGIGGGAFRHVDPSDLGDQDVFE